MGQNLSSILVTAALLGACSTSNDRGAADTATSAALDSTKPVMISTGFTQPEAVRYDPDQDVYFVGNWGPGSPAATDNNGYISRLNPDGTIEQLRFIAGGTRGTVLHAPRGMTIVGDTLWVVDADAVRGFNRRTGAPLATAAFSAYKLGFLNDIAAGPDGLYVTDTGTDHIYKIAGGKVSVALESSTLGGPNGITWDAAGRRFIVVPYGGGAAIKAWNPNGTTLTDVGRSTGSKYDGVEVLSGNRVLVASQADSSLHLFSNGSGRAVIRTGGDPADIAVDTKRNRVIVPFVARNLVEIWTIPAQ